MEWSASSEAGEASFAPLGSRSRAPIRKPSAPSAVNTFARARSRALPVDGTTCAATAEMPNATQPARFTRSDPPVRVRRPPRTSRYARQPETRKQIEPSASGVQTRRLYSVRLEAGLERVERADVEEDRSDELDGAAPPVEHPRTEEAALDVLQRGRRGEEDRTDEEDHAVDGRPDELHEAGNGADQEAGRADREEDADPPRRAVCTHYGAATIIRHLGGGAEPIPARFAGNEPRAPVECWRRSLRRAGRASGATHRRG